MRHQNKNKKFGRERNQRKALMRSLAVSLIKEGQIQTTEAKAKALRPYVEKLVTKAKKNNLASRRIVTSKIGNSADKLFKEVAVHYKDRSGGYTRITKLGFRGGDGSPMAKIEFV